MSEQPKIVLPEQADRVSPVLEEVRKCFGDHGYEVYALPPHENGTPRKANEFGVRQAGRMETNYRVDIWADRTQPGEPLTRVFMQTLWPRRDRDFEQKAKTFLIEDLGNLITEVKIAETRASSYGTF